MRTEKQKEQLRNAQLKARLAHIGKKLSEETKKKIGDANRRQIRFPCDFCGGESCDRPSHYKRKKHHFCSVQCYSGFLKGLPFWQQRNYKGIRKVGENKRIYHRRYEKNNPEIISHIKARRYARERGAKGSHTLKEWQSLKIQFDNKCAKCSKRKPLTKDHIVPLSKGGTDYIDNIQPLCHSCNSRKWTFSVFTPTQS